MSSNQTHTTASKSKMRVFFTLLQLFLIILLIVIAAMSFGTRIPLLAKYGFNFYTVTSGSMEPAIKTGSLIKVGRYEPENLKEGDIITYQKAGAEGDRAAIITHRIHAIETKEEIRKIEEGEEGTEDKKVTSYVISTKGDANAEPDNYTVSAGEVIGKYEWQIPYLGQVAAFAQTQKGFLLLVILPAVILIIWEVVALILHFKQDKVKKSEQEIARLKAELEEHKKNHE